ncbi:hypothetical protein FLONG3_11353, partial [Fusarium longipes]
MALVIRQPVVLRPASEPLPHPVPGMKEIDLRQQEAMSIERQLQRTHCDFFIRMEQVATILMVDISSFSSGGELSVVSVPPFTLRERLEDPAPLCKHYMQHTELGHNDLWDHAKHRPLKPQPPVTHVLFPTPDLNQFMKSMAWECHFRTQRNLQLSADYKSLVRECRDRDHDECVLTKHKDIRIFALIPFTWNDNPDNNDITGDLESGSVDITGINLLHDPSNICSATHLGGTHKSWNMICVAPDIYRYLQLGLCAFRFVTTQNHNVTSQVRVTLQFYWMPRMTPRFNQVMDKAAMQELVDEFNAIHDQNYPPPEGYTNRYMGMQPVESGRKAFVVLTNPEDAMKFVSMVKVHWGCALFTSLCGGAGCAAFMTGKNLQDGSLQPTKVPMED